MATATVAVERVVLRHLGKQLRDLDGIDAAAVRAINAIIHDEQEHYYRSVARAGQGGVLNRAVAVIVSGATEAVIRMGMRL
jgi:ubiquinone biosynthesis monooxygenase Coq7